MNTTNIFRSPRLLTLAAATLVGAAATFTSTNNAFATGDINIGVGELQECTISKSMDSASPKLTQFAINGNSAAGRGDPLGEFEIQTLMSTQPNADGAKGGNIEFEWKVEEGES